MDNKYDYLIVGAGLFGSVFAFEMEKAGKRCLVIDKRNHIGGNTYCKMEDGIPVHMYGPHLFHTNDERLWNYVNSITPFNNFVNSPLAYVNGNFYNLPFNMNTFKQVWGVETADAAQKKIREGQPGQQRKPQNLKEQAIELVGEELFSLFIKGYTEKQWGRKCDELPASIIKRIPVRFTYDNNYYNDRFQGIPIGGYNVLTEKLLAKSTLRLGIDYFDQKEALDNLANTTVYTGKIDEYFNYRYGALDYRSLRFEHDRIEKPFYQQNAIINYPSAAVDHTRIIEHKYFEGTASDHTVITREYPVAYSRDKEAYYPINDKKNNELYNHYKILADQTDTIFGGRLAEYKYYDMHQVIASSLKKVKAELAI